jgi:NAD(P)-dependent dehydrogenase (short-subunit alcohol dehydrogenase family)
MGGKAWLISGAGMGLGHKVLEQALARGDMAVVLTRKKSMLADLKEQYGDALTIVEQDLRERAQVLENAEALFLRYGSIDVLLNLAGYSVYGAVEEADETEARAIMDNNYFGALWLIQSVLPIMRRQGRGRILIGGANTGVEASAFLGLYRATKHALFGAAQALSQEVAPFGIRVSYLEPGMIKVPSDKDMPAK